MPARVAEGRSWGLALLVLAGCAGPTPRVATPAAPVATAPATGMPSSWAGGVAARDDRRGSALTAGVPALGADAVTYYVDVEEARLREQLAGTGVDVARNGTDVRLRLPGGAMFQTDRADLDARSRGLLDSIAAVLQKFDKSLVEIAGYTDSAGAAEHNVALSARRAEAVANYLQGRGIARARMSTIGLGEGHAVASNTSAEGRARNRRIELTVSPLVK